MVAVIPDSKGVEEILADSEIFIKKLGTGEGTLSAQEVKRLAYTIAKILKAREFRTFLEMVLLILDILVKVGILVTPLRWIAIAIAVVLALRNLGITLLLGDGGEERDNAILQRTKTPLDELAIVIFTFFASLGLTVAHLDKSISDAERRQIENYFIDKWGYSEWFVRVALPKLERNVEIFPIVELVDNMIVFEKRNPDCNYQALSKELIGFLQEVTEADDELHDLEVVFIQWLEIALANGKLGYLDGLRSAVGISRRQEQPVKGKVGPSPGPDSHGDALRDRRTGNGSSGHDGQQTSTMVGRAYRSTLHWLTT